MKINRPGNFFCLSSPAGAGKTTISELLLRDSPANLSRLVTCTTRTRRSCETEGVDYHFLSNAEFKSGIENKEFFEWQEVHGNLYGTKRASLEEARDAGEDLLLVIDIKGALSFKAEYPDNTVLTIVLPPSPEDLRFRLKARGTDTDSEVKTRLETAEEEYKMFLEHQYAIDYLVINDNLTEAVQNVYSVVTAERLKWSRTPASYINQITAFS